MNSVPQGRAGRKEVKWDILKIQDILVLQTRNGPGLPTKALEEEGLAPQSLEGFYEDGCAVVQLN